MLPFDIVFEDVARKESRTVALRDRRGRHVGTFLFREHYCADADCDCGIVLIHAVWAEQRQVAASFSYTFEPLPGEPELELDPFNPQSDLSATLLGTFAQGLKQDPSYRPALLRHYEMWKRVVDDPSHPEHGRLRPRTGAAPPARPGERGKTKKAQAAPRPKGPRPAPPREQRSLFSDVPAPPVSSSSAEAPATALELVSSVAPKGEGKHQARFRKLLEKVDRLKLRVRRWRESRAAIDSEIASYQAAQRQQDAMARQMVMLLDRAYGELSKADRRLVSEIIEDLAGGLLRDGTEEGEAQDAELVLVYERHTRRSFATEQAQDAAVMRSMLDALGLDLGDDLDLTSPEKLMQSVQEKLEAELGPVGRARAGDRPTRKRSAKQVAADARRAAEAKDAHKAVQEVYRQLARAIHPDRERDPAERDRKTALMREINAAYEARDLLRLLELQLELERLEGAESVTVLPEERLLQYVRVLEEQAKQLTAELDTIETPFRLQLGRGPGAVIDPVMVLDQIRADARNIEQNTAQLTNDLTELEDLARLKRWLKQERRRARQAVDARSNDIPF